MDWGRILAYITGAVDQELLLRNEYLAAENRIFKAQIHQGKGNTLLFPAPATRTEQTREPTIQSRKRLRGLLQYYYLEAE